MMFGFLYTIWLWFQWFPYRGQSMSDTSTITRLPRRATKTPTSWATSPVRSSRDRSWQSWQSQLQRMVCLGRKMEKRCVCKKPQLPACLKCGALKFPFGLNLCVCVWCEGLFSKRGLFGWWGIITWCFFEGLKVGYAFPLVMLFASFKEVFWCLLVDAPVDEDVTLELVRERNLLKTLPRTQLKHQVATNQLDRLTVPSFAFFCSPYRSLFIKELHGWS